MFGKNKDGKRSRRAKRNEPVANPKYDGLLKLWETALENDISDVLGSYTGRPADDDVPEQDADDL